MNLSPLIKICGLRCPRQAFAAGKLGADYIGLVFHPASPRNVELCDAKVIARAICDGGAIPVAVFVEQSVAEIVKIINEIEVTVVQLHGSQALSQINTLPENIIRILVSPDKKSLEIKSEVEAARQQLNQNRDFLLFDGGQPGTGQRIPLDNLDSKARPFRYFVAGGIRPNTVLDVLAKCTPKGVDVSTGVESQPGVKDLGLIRELIENVQAYRGVPHVR